MKIIIGQGNPGSEYSATRHNTGWMALDMIAQSHDLTFATKPKWNALIAEWNSDDGKILLVKPTTYYNETGSCVRSIRDFYQLTTEDILVIHDDISIPSGAIRVRASGSDAGNNGIRSLNAHIGQNYWRMRYGIKPDHALQDTASYVLARLHQS